jgi:hypothetical protein
LNFSRILKKIDKTFLFAKTATERPAMSGVPGSSSFDTLKNLATEVGNKITQAKSAIERRVTEAVAMFPLIDLTAEESMPVTAYEYDPRDLNGMATTRACPQCTYAGSPTSSNHCAVCQNPLPMIQSGVAGQISGKSEAPRKPRSSIYPSLSVRDDVMPVPLPPSPLLQSQDPSTWTCPKCTLQNSKTEKNCTACGSVSNGTREPIRRLTSLEQCWACSSCTFLNPQSGNVCLMCSKPKNEEGNSSKEKFEAEDVEELRKFHEQEAVQQWEGIMNFCHRVS